MERRLGRHNRCGAAGGTGNLGHGEVLRRMVQSPALALMPIHARLRLTHPFYAVCGAGGATGSSSGASSNGSSSGNGASSSSSSAALDVVVDWSSSLSLGEQQRLGWARLLLARPRLALLDEATSALDQDTEARLYQVDGVWVSAVGGLASG